MIARRFRSLCLLGALAGCGTTPPQGGRPSSPPAGGGAAPSVAGAREASATTAAPRASSAALATAALARIELTEATAASVPLPTPRIEVQRPSLGEVVESPLARSYAIRLEISGYVLTRSGQGAIVSLDGRRARRWPAEGSLTLGELLPEDEALSEGAHSLLVALVDADGRVLRGPGPGEAPGRSVQAPFFLVDFSIGHAAKVSDARRVFCLAPSGTYYGPAGQSVRLEFFPVGPVAPTLRLRVEGPAFDAWAELRPDRPYLASGLPFGDVVLTALDGADAVARCVITVNPEKRP